MSEEAQDPRRPHPKAKLYDPQSTILPSGSMIIEGKDKQSLWYVAEKDWAAQQKGGHDGR